MEPTQPTITIDRAFEEFLSQQKGQFSPKTLAKYANILDLMRSYLESYWPGHDGEEYRRITSAGGTYCGTFGPQEILGGLPEFLGYFMPHKVVAGKDTMKASGTVTKKLVRWLAAKGYVASDECLDDAEERARDAARDLPASQEVVDLLDAYLDEHSPARFSRKIDDHFTIKRIEPGRLWLEPLASGEGEIGPVPVPREVSSMCRPGWDIRGVVVKTSRGWRMSEVWNVTP